MTTETVRGQMSLVFYENKLRSGIDRRCKVLGGLGEELTIYELITKMHLWEVRGARNIQLK